MQRTCAQRASTISRSTSPGPELVPRFLYCLKTTLAYALYLFVATLLLPVLPLRLWWRSRSAPAYAERIAERFGVFEEHPQAGGLWVHAVSVGETLAIAPAIKTLLGSYPELPVTITTTTPTGSERVVSLFGDTVHHVYAPYDWPFCVWLFLQRVKPKLVVIVETELWPITIALCKLLGTRVLIANARLSQKSASGYAKLRWLVEPMLRDVLIAAQHEEDAKRFLALGADERCVDATGSIKYDLAINDEQRAMAMDLRAELAIDGSGEATDSLRFVWIAASTHPGEDEIILKAHSSLLEKHPQSLLLLVPRHPERFDAVARLLDAGSMNYIRRSEGRRVSRHTQVLLVDTMGELATFYGIADVAFVGGSFVPVGGHNYLEAAVWGLPVLTGPHRHNFVAIAQELEAAGALKVVNGAMDLCERLRAAVERPGDYRKMGSNAVQLIEGNRGATEKLLEKIQLLL